MRELHAVRRHGEEVARRAAHHRLCDALPPVRGLHVDVPDGDRARGDAPEEDVADRLPVRVAPSAHEEDESRADGSLDERERRVARDDAAPGRVELERDVELREGVEVRGRRAGLHDGEREGRAGRGRERRAGRVGDAGAECAGSRAGVDADAETAGREEGRPGGEEGFGGGAEPD